MATLEGITLHDIAKMIDLSLLHPTMTDDDIVKGLEEAKRLGVATACVKPYSIPDAVRILKDSGVGVCPVIGFPHGNSTTAVKVFEATEAVKAGGYEIDMVINVGKAVGGQWEYVEDEIRRINTAVVGHGGVLKVIFENDYLNDDQITRLCEICARISVLFVKTSTGYGFVKQANGFYNYRGATAHHLELMRKTLDQTEAGKKVQIKAAGGVRTLDGLLHARYLGVTRVGATAAKAILDEARERGIGDAPVSVQVKLDVL